MNRPGRLPGGPVGEAGPGATLAAVIGWGSLLVFCVIFAAALYFASGGR